MRKPFDLNLYTENDSIAKKCFKQWLKKRESKFVAKNNPDRYGPDLIIFYNGNPVGFAEVEIKKVWNTFKFPYPDVQIPERKIKFAQLGNINFIIFNNDLSRMLLFSGDTMLNSPLVEIPNKYISNGELFFKIPLSNVLFMTV